MIFANIDQKLYALSQRLILMFMNGLVTIDEVNEQLGVFGKENAKYN